MKRRVISGMAVILCLAAACIVALGFTVQTSAYLSDDFSVSADGSEMTFAVDMGSSMGYVRGYKDEGGGGQPHRLRFYSAWGGFNSSLGARRTFVLQLDPEDTQIFVYHGDRGYDLAMEKDTATGSWRRVS